MGFFDFMQKVNLAGSGDPNQKIFAGLASLGLQVTRREGLAITELGGTFQGRQAGMLVDASALMGAAGMAYASAASTAIASAAGLISGRLADYRTRMLGHRARSAMQQAQVLLCWSIAGGSPAPGPLVIGRTAETGPAVGPGLHASGDPALVSRLSHPRLLSQIQSALFDQIEVRDAVVSASLARENVEYQKLMVPPERLAQVTNDVLQALSGVAYLICEEGS